MIKIAVVDDEIHFISSVLNDVLIKSARKAKCDIRRALYTEGNKLIDDYKNGKTYDIVILDIEMPEINGKELAAILRKIDSSFFLVFISSYPEQVFDTLKYKVSAFIPKTSDPDFYITELSRVFKEYISYSENFELIETLNNGNLSTIRISPDNILGFYLNRHIIYMKTLTRDYILNEKYFNRITGHFTALGFYECYRNYLVNIRHITEIRETSLILTNNDFFQ